MNKLSLGSLVNKLKTTVASLVSGVIGGSEEPSVPPPPSQRPLLPQETAAQMQIADHMEAISTGMLGGVNDGPWGGEDPDATGVDPEAEGGGEGTESEIRRIGVRHEAFRVFGDRNAAGADTDLAPPPPPRPVPMAEGGGEESESEPGGARLPPIPVMPAAVAADAGKAGRPAEATALGTFGSGRFIGYYANTQYSSRDVEGGPFAPMGERDFRFVKESEKGEFQQRMDEIDRTRMPGGRLPGEGEAGVDAATE